MAEIPVQEQCRFICSIYGERCILPKGHSGYCQRKRYDFEGAEALEAEHDH